MSILITFTQHFVGNPNDTNQARKGNKIQLNWKERSKAVTICRWYDTLYIIGNPKDSIKRTISKIIGQKISLQKSAWRRQWQHTPVVLPVKSHGWRSLVGCIPWGRQELDMTERLHFHFSLSCIGEGNGNPLMFLPGELQGQGSLVGCRLWGHTELDTTEATQQQQQLQKSVAFLYTNNELSETEIKERIQFTIASKIDK